MEWPGWVIKDCSPSEPRSRFSCRTEQHRAAKTTKQVKTTRNTQKRFINPSCLFSNMLNCPIHSHSAPLVGIIIIQIMMITIIMWMDNLQRFWSLVALMASVQQCSRSFPVHWTTPTLFHVLWPRWSQSTAWDWINKAGLSYQDTFDLCFGCYCLPAIFYELSSLFWHVQHINKCVCVCVQYSGGLFFFTLNICSRHEEKQITTVTFLWSAVTHQHVKFGNCSCIVLCCSRILLKWTILIVALV